MRLNFALQSRVRSLRITALHVNLRMCITDQCLTEKLYIGYLPAIFGFIYNCHGPACLVQTYFL